MINVLIILCTDYFIYGIGNWNQTSFSSKPTKISNAKSSSHESYNHIILSLLLYCNNIHTVNTESHFSRLTT